jgi:hypothetical protein
LGEKYKWVLKMLLPHVIGRQVWKNQVETGNQISSKVATTSDGWGPFVSGNGLLLERVGGKGKARVREWKQGVSKEHAISYLHKRELAEE